MRFRTLSIRRQARLEEARYWLLAKVLGIDWQAVESNRLAMANAAIRAVYNEFKDQLWLEREVRDFFSQLTTEDQHLILNTFSERANDLPRILEQCLKLGEMPVWARSLEFGNVDSFSQEGEDLILRQMLPLEPRGFFVDIGAHHPYRFSNTAYFYQHGWRGINIDPAPGTKSLFEKYRPDDETVEVGIGESEGVMEFYIFDEMALNTMDKRRAEMLEKTTHYRIQEVKQIPIRRLDTLLDERLTGTRKIDFMSIDVEGLELSVLRSNDWDRFRPKFVLLETLNPDLEHLQQDPVVQRMKDLGYIPFSKGKRTSFFRDERLGTK